MPELNPIAGFESVDWGLTGLYLVGFTLAAADFYGHEFNVDFSEAIGEAPKTTYASIGDFIAIFACIGLFVRKKYLLGGLLLALDLARIFYLGNLGFVPDVGP